MLVLWPRLWSILVNIPCTTKKNVYFAKLDKVIYKCKLGQDDWKYWSNIFPCWLSIHSISYLGVFKSPTMIVGLPLPFCNSISFLCLTYLGLYSNNTVEYHFFYSVWQPGFLLRYSWGFTCYHIINMVRFYFIYLFFLIWRAGLSAARPRSPARPQRPARYHPIWLDFNLPTCFLFVPS